MVYNDGNMGIMCKNDLSITLIQDDLDFECENTFTLLLQRI